ncbi:MAG TPA: hypothetical protein VHY81_05650 [Acidimicrobiales bacterium]|jgi:hypothetical protein|nr:hypothetical protein [Acidimicrobiales bacterium]
MLNYDSGRRPDGAERTCGQLRPAVLSIRAHRCDPPDVTEGDRELTLGEDDEAPLLPVFPVELPVSPVLPDEPVVPVVPPAVWPDVVVAAVFPGCSCTTTMAIPTVAPVVARSAALVTVRRRARA